MRRWGRHHTGWREFSFSRRSPLSVRMRAPRAFLASKETPTIMEFPPAFNEERRLGVRELAAAFKLQRGAGEARLLLAHRLRRIMARNERSKSGGLRNASKKAH